MQKEVKWNLDLIELLNLELKAEFPEYRIMKGKVLKDIFLSNDEGFGYSLQFGFVDQDIVIYNETMDISDFKNVENIFLHNIKENRDKLVIPKIIIELKYNGVNSHGLITYSTYAAEIKSIFPQCQYYLAMRYKGTSSENKLFRHGKNFNKIICFEDSSDKSNTYTSGNFAHELSKNSILKSRYNDLIESIKVGLRPNSTCFIKY